MPFRFEYADHLYMLILLPLLLLFFLWVHRRRKKALRRFGSEHLLSQMMPLYSKYKHTLKFILFSLSLLAIIIAWANPQWGIKREPVKRKSVDIFIALDISQSMMAEDIGPNRLERARKFAQQLVNALRGNRMGIIVFAGNAYLQMPLTTDYAAAQLFLKSANPDQAPTQGTAIGDVIDLAEKSFEEDNKQHKAIIIITDGETHDQEALALAQNAADNGLLIYTIGVGTPRGGLVPAIIGGREDYKRDQTGNPVRSSLNEEMLKDLAEIGNAFYFNLIASDPSQVSQSLKSSIDKLEKREFEARVFNEYESYFQYFIALALLFLVFEFIISYKKNRWVGNKDLFG